MLSYKLEKFEGPLDLLLHLIEKNKVSIYDIPIFEITNQYMEYVNAMEEENLDIVSEFLVMTATLLDIKSRLLLPAEKDENGDEIDPREELVTRLVEYKTYKSLGEQLKSRQLLASRLLYKDPTIPDEVSKYEPPVNVQDMNIAAKQEKLSFTVVLDGHIMEENLKLSGNNKKWLENELQKQKIGNVKDVFIALCDGNNTLSVYKKTDDSPKNDPFQ